MNGALVLAAAAAAAAAAASAPDWGGLAILALLAAGACLHVVLLARRVRVVADAGWEETRAHPRYVVGILCGMTLLVLGLTYLAIGWSTGPGALQHVWDTHRWHGTLLFVCGLAFGWTDPRRPHSAVERLRIANARAHPGQSVVGFLAGAGIIAALPLSTLLPAPARPVFALVWPILLLVELGCAGWLWQRHGQLLAVTEGQRTRYLPTFATHPAFMGWIWGAMTTVLVWVMLAQTPTGR